jgi:hypothetical protein
MAKEIRVNVSVSERAHRLIGKEAFNHKGKNMQNIADEAIEAGIQVVKAKRMNK